MSDTLLISTRKGLFTVSRKAGQWEITGADFLGDNVSITLIDRRDGRHYAALDHGHFGVKLHRSTATGWEEIAAPTYPPKPDGYEEYDMWSRPLNWSTARIWALEAGGPDEPGVIWCGTLPGGLFRSTDRGQSWEMIRALWDHPKRKQWMGGGADLPGIHSICVDPRNSRRVWVAVSTGGIWFTEDAGASWAQRGEGMRAEHPHPTADLFGAVRMTWRRWQFAASNEVLHGYDNPKKYIGRADPGRGAWAGRGAGRGVRDANRRCNEQSIWRSSGISRQSRKGSSRGGNFHSHARSGSPKQGGNIQWQPDPGDRTLLGFDGHS